VGVALLHEVTPVVRGGTNRNVDELFEDAQFNSDRGAPALSVFWAVPNDGESEEEYLLRVCREATIPHGKIQLSTPAQLKAANLTLVPDESDGQPMHHHHVIFQVPVSKLQIEAFVSAFSEPRPNPTGGNRRKR
jgi:hypothetical protein